MMTRLDIEKQNEEIKEYLKSIGSDSVMVKEDIEGIMVAGEHYHICSRGLMPNNLQFFVNVQHEMDVYGSGKALYGKDIFKLVKYEEGWKENKERQKRLAAKTHLEKAQAITFLVHERAKYSKYIEESNSKMEDLKAKLSRAEQSLATYEDRLRLLDDDLKYLLGENN